MNGPIKQTLGKSLQRPPDQSGWPDGWYLYEDGEIKGPLTASQTFALSVETPEGNPRLVSRKGFAQWHTLKDLADLYARSNNSTSSLAQEISNSYSETPRVIKGSPASSRSPSMARPVSGTQPLSEAESLILESDRDFAFGSGLLEPSQVQAPAKRPQSARTAGTRRAQTEVLQNYLASRNRLRLGELRQAWICGFMGWSLTLGAYWLVWFRALAKEINEHRDPSHGKDAKADAQEAPDSSSAPESLSTPLDTLEELPPLWLAALPLIHCYMVYRLACLLKKMEEENHYAKTVPWLAALFSLIPPLAIVYLQSQANTHWLLHVRHVMVKERAAG